MVWKFLRKAKKNKNDEFYTRMIDIERELKHYRNQFKGKIVYCNCDDPTKSNFYKFLLKIFHNLGIKKLISSCYENDINIFNFKGKKSFINGFIMNTQVKKRKL
ncbi:adenine-specific methyltransferase EcoRI family protein [Streptococcus dysgalactiae]|uniref:adenine-specific methyltransferase EcoRI family protein n=1 Tax=Streptococcus dysgalactiae TaxID=1334 RepID=UPI003BA9476D